MNRLKPYIVLIVCAQIFTACTMLRNARLSNYTELTNELRIDMISVEGGEFMMGCDASTTKCSSDGLPLHKIELNDFYISKYEITNEQYNLFCEATNREKPTGANIRHKLSPAIYVNWHDAIAFCHWLSKISGRNYRLPTEAEWEYAARGGRKSKAYTYAGSNNADKVAWYIKDKNSQNEAQQIGEKKPNELGIYDMSGNVWEWCLDYYDANFYEKSPTKQPFNTQFSATKVARGGGWCNPIEYCRTNNRDYDNLEVRDNDLGFRIVMAESNNDQSLKLEKVGSHYFIGTRINGVAVNFLLESGIPALLLDSAFYENNKESLNLSFTPSKSKIRLMNKLHDIILKSSGVINIGDVIYDGPVFILSGNTPPAVPIQFFKNAKDKSPIIKIDLRNEVLQVLSRKEFVACHNNALDSCSLSFNQMGMPVVKLDVDFTLEGKPLKLRGDFILDYGNGSHLFLLKQNQAVLDMINSNDLSLSEAKNPEGIVVAEGMLFNSMKLMGKCYENVSVGMTDKMKFCGEAGLVGLKSMHRCLFFDIDNAKVYFINNK